MSALRAATSPAEGSPAGTHLRLFPADPGLSASLNDHGRLMLEGLIRRLDDDRAYVDALAKERATGSGKLANVSKGAAFILSIETGKQGHAEHIDTEYELATNGLAMSTEMLATFVRAFEPEAA